MQSVEALVEDLKSVTQKLATQDPVGLNDAEIEALLSGLQEAESALCSTVVSAAAEVEVRGAHLDRGFRSVSGYLTHHLRIRHASAAATARLAHKHRSLPHTMNALRAGQISEAHAQIISRAYSRRVAEAFDRDEPLMIEKAQELSFRSFYWFIRHWINIADPERGKDDADRAVRERRLHCSRVGDRIHTNAVSDVISGTALKEAIDRVKQELFAADWRHARATHGDAATPADMPRTAAQRRHDALIEIALRATATSTDRALPEPLVNIICDWDTFSQATLDLAGGRPRYHPEGTCELLDGTPVTPQQALEQALLGHVSRIVMGAEDTPINAGRSRRLFTKRMKAILATKNRHCTWPGCELPPSRCETDHIKPWNEGGPTNVANARLACPYHHRMFKRPRGP